MEVLLTDKLGSLYAYDTSGVPTKLTVPQTEKIINTIKPHCSGCGLCLGIGSVTSSGHPYSLDGSISVPAACPLNGEKVNV